MKTCFRCKLEKPLSEFYRHPQMGDGHLGKCKECTKRDVLKRYLDPVKRQAVREYEKRRFQDPERKAKLIIYQREKRKRNKVKYAARALLARTIKRGLLARLPLEVQWLCFRHHREAHGQTVG